MSAILFTQNSNDEQQQIQELPEDKQILNAVDSCDGIFSEQINCYNNNDGTIVKAQLHLDIPSTLSTADTNRDINDSLNTINAPMNTKFDNDCAALLESQMAALELTEYGGSGGSHHGDGGSDSGLDTATTTKSATILLDCVGDNINDNGGESEESCSAAVKKNIIEFQRALSNNSGGYASSTGCGIDPDDDVINPTPCATTPTTTPTTILMATATNQQGSNMSGNSSLLSCGSEAVSGAELAAMTTATTSTTNGAVSSATQSFECYSENGSESSSMLGGVGTATITTTDTATTTTTTPVRRTNSVKSKMRVFESTGRGSFATPMSRSMRERDCSSSTPISTNQTNAHVGNASTPRTRTASIKRTSSLSRHVPGATAPTSSAQRQSDRQHTGYGSSNSKTSMAAPSSTLRVTTAAARATKPQKPDSLPNALSRTQSMSMQRLVQRTPSLSRARTPCTPSEDGRWPGNARASSASLGASKRGTSVTPELMSLSKMRSTNMMASMEVRSTTNSNANSNPYSTLPRRRKQKSVEDLTVANESRSSSVTRDTRMTTSVMANTRRSLVSAFGSATTPQRHPETPTRSSMYGRKTPAPAPPAPAPTHKTRIYHETSSQTALTCDDLEKAFAGRTTAMRAIDAVDQHEQTTQTDMRDAELERLRDEVRQLAQREHELHAKLQREREEKLATQRELHLNTERVMSMLEMARIAGRRCGRTGGGGGGGGSSVSGLSLDGDATTPTSDEGSGSGHDSLLMLESQIQMSGHVLIERQHEIGQLRQLCRTLQLEMERSLAAQECLLQEKAAIEQESSELQDFLQHEKSALCDALKELESEHQTCKQQLAGREEEVKVLRDECRHLVRLNEQRRQENRMLQSKYAALENKSKEMMLQQNYSVSGASAALSGLHSRLDSLVEQLVSTYNITDHDLEDIGFQPEAQQIHNNAIESRTTQNMDECLGRLQSGSSSSSNNANGLDLVCRTNTHSQQFLPQTSDGSLSPQRNQSFIAAVISAIRNATTPSSKKLLARNGKRLCIENSIDGGGDGGELNVQGSSKNNLNTNYNNCNGGEMQNRGGDDSDSTEMLDSETEPCLMMDNVLEDVTMPDSHSHNMVSSCTGIISQIEIPSELVNTTTGDESLHNLSQAIVNRQQMELQISTMQSVQNAALQLNQCGDHDNSDDVSCHDSVAEMPSLMEYCTAQAVVDQVIEVDCLVTKLLKVLRLIQMDNDNCIQQLIVDKNKLQENKEDMLEKLKDLQDVNIKLQDELMDATQELMLKNNDLSNTKAEMQRHRNEIDRLTQDICNLSTLCSNYKKLSPTIEFSPLQQQLLRGGSNQTTTTLTPLKNGTAKDDVVMANGDGNAVEESDVDIILNLLKMWQIEGQFQQTKIRNFLLSTVFRNHEAATQKLENSTNERLRVYANQLENVLSVLQTCADDSTTIDYGELLKLRNDIEIVKGNANWTNIIVNDQTEVNSNSKSAKLTIADNSNSSNASNNNINNEDVNANAPMAGELKEEPRVN